MVEVILLYNTFKKSQSLIILCQYDCKVEPRHELICILHFKRSKKYAPITSVLNNNS